MRPVQLDSAMLTTWLCCASFLPRTQGGVLPLEWVKKDAERAAGAVLNVSVKKACEHLWQTPQLELPFLVGLPQAPTAPATMSSSPGWPSSDSTTASLSWLALRRETLRQGVSLSNAIERSAIGRAPPISALGLPSGAGVVILTDSGFRVRTLLGSVPLAKFSLDALLEKRRLAIERRNRCAIETSRAEALASIRAALASAGVDPQKAERAVASSTAAGCRSRDGVLRGQCPQCNACPGFCPPKLLPARLAEWKAYCVHCGCEDSRHEGLREQGVDSGGEGETAE